LVSLRFLSIQVVTDHFVSDVIHVKSVLYDVPGYTSLIDKLAMVLRPGGLLVLVEAEARYVSPDRFLPFLPSLPPCPSFFFAVDIPLMTVLL
jgi:hypothetical protein